DTARAQVSESRARRALLDHAIAVLVGESPSSVAMPPDTHWIASPQIPPGLPASLLQRRPDVAAAERRVAAANASIGVARAAFFPDLSLSATIGFQSTNTDNWLMAPSTFWAVGPTLTQTLFDAGLHNAQLAAAKARLDETAARYRSTVLGAFQQVEDNLALLENYKIEYVDESAAVASAQKTLDISMTQYRDGGVSYLEVVDSQTAALAAEQAQLRLETRQVRASIDLVRALGGGWTSSDAAAAPAMKPTPAPG
ncbi:MAG: efflux transporter outer membrane subunit, partial [Nevskia sp.]|nr:efflux transporter outer membrane subunit [Nevskia sp.]